MAYIPTIHTFEDDIKENSDANNASLYNSANNSAPSSSILIPDKKEKSLTKKILNFITVLLLIGSVSVVSYYFYTKWKVKKEATALNENASAIQNSQNNTGVENDLQNIFPKLSLGISQYVSSVIKKNNVIILTLKNDNTVDSYSYLYTYILAHNRDLNSDLYSAFNVGAIIDSLMLDDSSVALNTENASSANATETSAVNIENGSSTSPYIQKAKPISIDNISWEAKTINNQNLEIASAGVINFVYGYVGQEYLIFSTSIKDFFDAANSLK